MEWPDSVHLDALSANKRVPKLRTRVHETNEKRYSAGQQEQVRRQQRDAHPFIPSGVVLDAGSRGAAVLKSIREESASSRGRRQRKGQPQVPRQRWNWEFANVTRPDPPLQFSEEAAIFFPPTIRASEETKVSIGETAIQPRTSRRQPLSRSKSPAKSGRNGKRKIRGGSTSSNDTPAEDAANLAEQGVTGVTSGGQVEGSQADEDEEERAAPPEQQAPLSSIPGSMDADPTPDLVPNPIEETHNRSIRLTDNRNALATIRYSVKVGGQANMLGFESHTLHYVVFPMGPQGNQLNISLFKTVPATRKRPSKMPQFIPTAEPSFVCKDRILQVSVSNKRRAKYPFICIAVRTESLLYYLVVTPISTSIYPRRHRPGDPVVRVELLSLVDSDGLEGARCVDIAMHPSHFQQCLIVTDAGVLYKWSIVRRASVAEGFVHEGKLVRIMQVPEEQKYAGAPDFYRAVWGLLDDTALFMNASHAWFLDIENPKIVVNSIDLSHTSTLFTSVDSSVAERDAEYLCLCTTDALMWMDARDGQLVLSWEHMRQGESLEVRTMPVKADTIGETVYLVHSSSNRKATLLHVRESMEGIQSRRNPYDILLAGEEELTGERFTTASSSRHIVGFSALFIEEAPMTLSLLLFLEDNGQLSCSLQRPRNTPNGEIETTDIRIKGYPDNRMAVEPDQLVLRHHHLVNMDNQVDDIADDAILHDVLPYDEQTCEEETDALGDIAQKRIRTRELWTNLCNARSHGEALFSLASLRNFLNDHEQLPETGIFTLHELLAMSCETFDNDDQARSDSLKSYTLGFSHDRSEKTMQLQDLLERSKGVLDRSDLRISELRDTIHSITADISLVPVSDNGLKALEEGYLGGIDVYSSEEPLGKVHQRQQDAAFRLLCDLHLSATTLASPANSDPQRNDNDANISETLSRLSFSPISNSAVPSTTFLKPLYTAKVGETTSATIQALSSQWAIGRDPSEYVWPGRTNHRILDPEEHVPASSSHRPASGKQIPLTPAFKLPRQSALFDSSPALNSPLIPHFATSDSLPMLNTHSQVHFQDDSQRQTQDFPSTQIVQGPFGGRNGPSFRRSLGKKRTIGF